jgi:hypothetical protein
MYKLEIMIKSDRVLELYNNSKGISTSELKIQIKIKMSKTFKKNKRAVKRKFAELEDDMMADERAMMGSLKRGKTGFDVLQNALSEHADRLSPS